MNDLSPPCRPTVCAELAMFLARVQRLPRVGDPRPPWTYQGWLLPYVIQIHEYCPAVADRWGYHLRTLEAGKLLDEPIPQVSFGAGDPKILSLVHSWCLLINQDCGGWGDFRTLLDWLCWGLALSAEPPHLSNAINEKLYRQVNLGPLLERPHDHLGDFVAKKPCQRLEPDGLLPDAAHRGGVDSAHDDARRPRRGPRPPHIQHVRSLCRIGENAAPCIKHFDGLVGSGH